MGTMLSLHLHQPSKDELCRLRPVALSILSSGASGEKICTFADLIIPYVDSISRFGSMGTCLLVEGHFLFFDDAKISSISLTLVFLDSISIFLLR
jgi:hypothetical protein